VAAEEAPDPEVKINSPSRRWRGRSKTVPLPRGEAVRQGDITREAFLLLGKADAIAFLNTENLSLGGRPIALATESAAGHTVVREELQRLSAMPAQG
jgi:hypothetical protein